MQYLYVQFIFSSQESSQICIFHSIIKTRTQVNKKLEACLFRNFNLFFFFVIGRTLSHLPSFWNEPCPAGSLHVPKWIELQDKNRIPDYATMQKNSSPF